MGNLRASPMGMRSLMRAEAVLLLAAVACCSGNGMRELSLGGSVPPGSASIVNSILSNAQRAVAEEKVKAEQNTQASAQMAAAEGQRSLNTKEKELQRAAEAEKAQQQILNSMVLRKKQGDAGVSSAEIRQESDKLAAATANVAALRGQISRAKEAIKNADKVVKDSSNAVLQDKTMASGAKSVDEKKAEILENARAEAAAVVQAKIAEKKEIATKKSEEDTMRKRHKELMRALKNKNTKLSNNDVVEMKRDEQDVSTFENRMATKRKDVERQKA